MRKFFLVLFVLSITQVLSVNAQNSLNDYKYVVVPHYFDFVAGEDAYRLNTMTRFLLKKQGFNAFMEKEIDERDYELNKCLALTARMVNIKSALKTKLKLELRNCDDEIVFESGIGTSKVKTYEIAYKKALTAAFETMKDVKYTYTPNEKIISRARKSQSEDEVKELKAEIAKLKKEKKKETTTSTVKESKASKSAKKPKLAKATTEDKTYYIAKKISNGYDLLDSNTNTVKLTLLKTGMTDVFTVKNKNGIVYKKDGVWTMEYTVDGNPVYKVLNISF